MITQEERALEQLNHKINLRGVPVDDHLVDDMLDLDGSCRERLHSQMKELTGLDNPNSVVQLKQWLNDRDVQIPDLRADTVDAWVAKTPEGSIERQVLQGRRSLASTASKKWAAFSKARFPGTGCVHSMFQYLGASRTGRWSGRQVQLQNMARGWPDADTQVDQIRYEEPEDLAILYGDPMMALSQTVRTAISAPAGHVLSICDLSAIESRLLGWLAECGRINDTFRCGRDSYKDFATQVYRKHYDHITGEERTFCKPCVLGAGYMLGWRGLQAYAEGYGQQLTEEESKTLVFTWRETYVEVPEFWQRIKYAVMTCTRKGTTFNEYNLKIERDSNFLRIQLPSKRYIYYFQPQVIMKKPPWEGNKIPAYSYMGRDQFTTKWGRITAHAGGLTENIIQAIARDILGYQMLEMDKRGLDIFLHVHDEVGVVSEQSRLAEMQEIMRIPPPWAEGLVLDAEGFDCFRYHK